MYADRPTRKLERVMERCSRRGRNRKRDFCHKLTTGIVRELIDTSMP